jgi:hypothetical protein
MEILVGLRVVISRSALCFDIVKHVLMRVHLWKIPRFTT